MYGRCGRCKMQLSIFVPSLYAVHDCIIHCFVQSYKFAYNEVCVSGHLTYLPFFPGIPAVWFSALPLHNLPYYRSDRTYIPCVLWKKLGFQLLLWVLFVFISAPAEKQSIHTKPKPSEKPRVPHTKPGNGILPSVLCVCV